MQGVDWPISCADVAPFYNDVETCLGIYGNSDNLASLPDGEYVGVAKLSPSAFKAPVEKR